MRLLETQIIENFNLTQIEKPVKFEIELHDTRKLSYDTVISNTPAITSTYDGIIYPDPVPEIVEPDDIDKSDTFYKNPYSHNGLQLVLSSYGEIPLWDDKKLFPVGRFASFHGRNLEILAKTVMVEDSYGNAYSSVCIKGADLSNPHFFESETADREFIIHGLQESLVIERVIRASNVLRKNNIPTEYICGLVLPITFPIEERDSYVNSTSSYQLHEFLGNLASTYAENKSPNNGLKRLEIAAEMMKKFQDCDYLITYRAMDCPFRMSELTEPVKFDKFIEFAKKNFLEPEDQEYFSQVTMGEHIVDLGLPIGNSLAKMHKLGIVHRFLHANNFTATGSIVDLDSCRGPAIGLDEEKDKEPTEYDFLRDIIHASQSLYITALYQDPSSKNLDAMEAKSEIIQNGFEALLRFFYSYADTMGDNIPEKSQILSSILRIVSIPPNIEEPADRKAYINALAGVHDLLAKEYYAENNIRPNTDLLDIDLGGLRTASTEFALPPTFFYTDSSTRKHNTWKLISTNDSEGNKLYKIESIRGAIECSIIDLIYDHHGQNETLNEPELMLTIGAILEDEHSSVSPEDNKLLKNAHHKTFNKILEYYSKPRDFFGKKLPKSVPVEQIGRLYLQNDDYKLVPHSIPVTYLKTKNQYLDLINELEINKASTINTLSVSEFTNISDNPENILVISDYKMVDSVSSCPDTKSCFEKLCSNKETSRPTIVIKNYMTTSQEVYILDPKDTGMPKLSLASSAKSYAEFMELLGLKKPKPATAELSLF